MGSFSRIQVSSSSTSLKSCWRRRESDSFCLRAAMGSFRASYRATRASCFLQMLSASKWPASWNCLAWIVMPSIRSCQEERNKLLVKMNEVQMFKKLQIAQNHTRNSANIQYQLFWKSFRHCYLVSSHISLQQSMFLLKILDAGQVFAKVIGG